MRSLYPYLREWFQKTQCSPAYAVRLIEQHVRAGDLTPEQAREILDMPRVNAPGGSA